MKKIYIDHAATTKLDAVAFESMKPWMMCEYGNASGIYSFSRRPKKALQEAREIIAACINAFPDEIYFTSGGTESDNWAIKGTAMLSGKKHAIVTSEIEHHAVLHSSKYMESIGYPVTYISPTEEGVITPEILEEQVPGSASIVSVMLANNEIGTVQPVKELAAVAHAHGAVFHTDAVQAVGHIGVDVHKLNVDMLSASAHKFNGPKGIGFLYLRRGVDLPPYLDGGAQENGLRAGTENVAGIVGMSIALKNNVESLEINKQHIGTLENQFMKQLNENNIPYIRNGRNEMLPGLISLSFEGKDGESILHRMDLMGISLSTGSACNSKSTQISHVLKAIRLPETFAKGTIRISLGKDNTIEDVNAIVGALKKIISS